MKSIKLTIIQTIFTLVLYATASMVLAVALIPGYLFYVHVPYVLLGLSGGYFISGLSLVFLVGIIRTVLSLKLKEGEYKIGSFECIKWYFVNSLFLVVRIVFMDFMLLTPFCSLFYRLMGAKMGRNIQINSKNVADHSLLEVGDNAVIGGNATVIGHSFEVKGLRLSKVKIGRNVIIGLNSVIMPGVVIGDGAVVAAGAIVPKNTVIEPKTVYYGPEKSVK